MIYNDFEEYKKVWLTPTFPPQGDGNVKPLVFVKVEFPLYVDPYLSPARGRKPMK